MIWISIKNEDLAKQKFINNKSQELKQLIEKWKLYGQALIKDSLDAANFSGLFFTIKSKTSMLDNWQPSIDPNYLSKKGEYYILIKKLKDLTNGIEKKHVMLMKNFLDFIIVLPKMMLKKLFHILKLLVMVFIPKKNLLN
ncbi:hypothetical protein [Ureaplasma parvum]|uniref:hypothetical protein n=1 Tax=Ureaplasma parvum TaxID=134821 RepID=UPI0026EF4985|nr:hypothetical protein [Ureaplasma parvum]